MGGLSRGFLVSGRTLGSPARAFLGPACLGACVVLPARELGEPGSFRLLPVGLLWGLWAPYWGRLGVLLSVPGAFCPRGALARLPVGSVGWFLGLLGLRRVALGSLSACVLCFGMRISLYVFYRRSCEIVNACIEWVSPVLLQVAPALCWDSAFGRVGRLSLSLLKGFA